MKGKMAERAAVREYQETDMREIAMLFYDTVHTVNSADYSREQLDAWADGKMDEKAWNQSFLRNKTYVAVMGEQIAGFGDLAEMKGQTDGGSTEEKSAYLDRLYVHKDCQRRGIATLLTRRLEAAAAEAGACKVVTHASITAKPFFEKHGYKAVKEQQVERKGVALTNFIMEKQLGD